MRSEDDYFNEEVLDLEALRRAYEKDNRPEAPSGTDHPRTVIQNGDDEDEDLSYQRMRSRRSRRQRRRLVFVALGAVVLLAVLIFVMKR